ncbi:hypothetical protein EX30DRAFT_367272 [Ascodesmis nigricans]|uniref:F-box domain-containing protein n=1 Tax=Ascodesmis nigricans TaxID=341454 RepID=A0A4S2MIK6_9PEZI|nr:hypothetical protein EX30DRAFT_367272 [Ascodesmis nigricans]
MVAVVRAHIGPQLLLSSQTYLLPCSSTPLTTTNPPPLRPSPLRPATTPQSAMASFTLLPVELIDHIVSFIPPTKLKTLSNVSMASKKLYNSAVPVLYRRLHIQFSGRASWDAKTNALQELAPPGSYHTPNAPAPFALDDLKTERKPQLAFIREVQVEGYWNNKYELRGAATMIKDDLVDERHGAFLKALVGVLYSIDQLDSFIWNVITPIGPDVTVALSRFDSLMTVDVNCDTHMVAPNSSYTWGGASPSIPTLSPAPLYHNSLHTLKINQLSSHNQAMQFGDVIRSPTNWRSLRHLEIDISPPFVSSLLEIEPVEPDVIFALFRPPPPPRGFLMPAKLELETLKMKEVFVPKSAVDALAESLDSTKLKNLEIHYCQDVDDLLKMWTKHPLPGLENLVVRDEPTITALTKFLKQFGPDGTCRNLKSLDLSSATMPSIHDYDQGYHDYYQDYLFPGDADSDMDDFDIVSPVVFSTFHAQGPTNMPPLNTISPPSMEPKDTLPLPWQRLRNLGGSREEGWGLESLILDVKASTGFTAYALHPVIPRQDIFFSGFWNLRELACPVSYETETWYPFVETIATLQNLTHLCLLNSRPDPHRHLHRHSHPTPYWSAFNLHPPPTNNTATPPPPRTRSSTSRQSRRRKTQPTRATTTDDIDTPDLHYVDALTLAACSRLSISPPPVSSSSPAPQSSPPPPPPPSHRQIPTNRLEYIGIRTPSPVYTSTPLKPRIWQVVLAPDTTEHAEGNERRRSLRSSTKRRRVEKKGEWRVKREGGWECALRELAGRPGVVEGVGGRGVFWGRDGWGAW